MFMLEDRMPYQHVWKIELQDCFARLLRPTVHSSLLKNQFTLLVTTNAKGETLPCQVVFKGTTHQSLPKIEGLIFSRETLPSEKKSRSFITDAARSAESVKSIFANIGSWSVTENHWSDAYTSKTYIQDIVDPYYRATCEKLGKSVGKQKLVLLVDCWWGWRDEGFRQFIRLRFPYIQLLFVPARCTPVAQPNDCGVIAILKGNFFKIQDIR
mmetsp:Transcript_15844/g.42788  ORF Transcript_15844/g.42788 Transcript_15844/m.42788 type:complete len:212 (-) Transcript_15844:698-1333(-)